MPEWRCRQTLAGPEPTGEPARTSVLADDAHTVAAPPSGGRAAEPGRLALLAAFGARARESRDLDALRRDACACAVEGLRAEGALVLEHGAAADDFSVRAAVGTAEGLVRSAAFAADSASPVRRAFQTGAPLAFQAVVDGQPAGSVDLLRTHGIAALLCVPIGVGHAAYGVLAVGFGSPRRLGREAGDFLCVLAGVLAGAIDRDRAERGATARSPSASPADIREIAERKRIEAALREREERLEAALFASTTGTYRWDIHSRALDWDPSLVRLFGQRPDELADFLDCIHPDDRAAVAAATEQCRLEGVDFDMDYRILRPDGSVRWVADKGKTFCDADGRPLYMTGACTDITDRKQAELALRESETRFRSTFEQAAVGMAHVGLDGSWLRVNGRFCDIVGYTPDELLTQRFQDITHPDDLDTDLANAERLLAGEASSYAMEKRYIRKDGRVIWIRLTVSLVRDEESGAPQYFICAVEDIDQHRRAAEALRERDERLRAALSASSTGTYRWDVRTDALQEDESMSRLIGLPPGQTLRHMHDFFERVHAEDRAAVIAATRRCVEEGTDFAMDYRIVTPDGTVRWLAERGQLFRDAAGRPLYMTGACTDVSARKRAEAQQKLLTAELDHRVRNTLTVVQAIAAQTLMYAPSPEAFNSALMGRLRALAGAHGLLTRNGWRSAELQAVVWQALHAHAVDELACEVDGPTLTLTPKQVLGLGLVLHELATNAAKYGALSSPGGRVTVRWIVTEDGQRLRFTWAERGGPPVTQPKTSGFGTKLIEQSIAYELRGSATLTYDPEGLRCDISLPWR